MRECIHSRSGEVWLFPLLSESRARWFESSFLDQVRQRWRQSYADYNASFRSIDKLHKFSLVEFGLKVLLYRTGNEILQRDASHTRQRFTRCSLTAEHRFWEPGGESATLSISTKFICPCSLVVERCPLTALASVRFRPRVPSLIRQS
jgi:hypothetical protein